MTITKQLKKRMSTVLMLSAIVLPIVASSGVPAYASFENGVRNNSCDTTSSSSDSSSSSGGASQTSGGVNIDGMGFVSQDKIDNAKAVAKWLNDNLGFGEDQLGVILAIAFKESGWRLDAWNASGGVGGFFQWSGDVAINGDRLGAAGVADDHKQHMTLDDTYKVLNYEIKEGHSASATIMNGLMRDAGNDASKVNYAWGNKYEGLAGNEDQMHTDDIMARYKGIVKAIGADSMKINQEKINALPTSTATAGGANTAASSDGTTTSTTTSNCDTSSSDTTDGTGAVSSKGAWKKDDVPDDVKQYIHDPAKVGLAYHGSDGWLSGINAEHDNCTDFSESYFNKLWGLNMSTGLANTNGADVAQNMAKLFGGSVSNTPHAGDVFSTPSNAPGSGGYGHTGIVEHVLENGDLIISEQNVTGYSGDLNGGSEEWNYRVVNQNNYQSGQWTFYHPEGKAINWG